MSKSTTKGITLLVALIAGILLFIFGNILFIKEPVCLYNRWIGLPCPLCGLTRAVYEFLHFRFASAWVYNPLVYLLMFWYGVEVTTYVLPNLAYKNGLKIFRLLVAALVLLFMILRMFKCFPLP